MKLVKKLIILNVIVSILGLIIYYSLGAPTTINALIASKVYDSPANNAFEDQNFYNCVIDAYNETNNTQEPYTTNLSDSQLKTITDLFCRGRNKDLAEKVTSAKGIEKLTALESLEVSYNKLTNLDVSSNPALVSLHVYNNQLTDIDVSSNPALEYLNVSSNQLTDLDVSSNPTLEDLRVASNQLTKLDVSSNPALEYLYAHINQLTDIDVSSNPALRTLHIDNNQLTDLDVSSNPALQELSVYNNQLTDLDVSSNPTLKILDAKYNQLTDIDISSNPALEILRIDNNQLTDLDVSSNHALKELSVYKNQLTDIDVSSNSALQELYIYKNQLTDLDVSANLALVKLNASSNQLTNLDVSSNPALETLYVNNNQLTDLDVSLNSKLESLNINNNPYKEEHYVYKNSNEIKLGNNVKIPSHLNWNSPTWKSDNDRIATVENDIAKIVGVGTVNITGTVTNEYTTTSTIHVIEITSDKYKIGEDYIYIGSDSDISTIKSNINVPENITIDVNMNIKNINKLTVKHDEETLKEFKIVRVKSTKYDLTKDYIYTGNEELDINNIEVTNGNKTIEDNLLKEDNILQIKYNNEVLQEFKIVKVKSSKYDLTKDYIYTGNEELDINNIEVTNGGKTIENNTLKIKYNEEILQEFKIVRVESEEYDITKDYVYIGNEDFNIDKVRVINGSKEVNQNKLQIKYEEELLKELPIIGIKFGNLKVSNNMIVIDESIPYQDFISNITPNRVTYKIFNESDEVTSDNIEMGMNLKVYYNENEIDSYDITDEYLYFDEDITVNENKKYLEKIKLETTAEQLLKKIHTSGSVTITNSEGNTIEGEDIVGTGSKVKVTLSSTNYEYTVVVLGDLNSDGKVTIGDVSKLFQYLRKKIQMDDYYIVAGNVVSSDNEIKIGDVAKLFQYLRKKIDSLE